MCHLLSGCTHGTILIEMNLFFERNSWRLLSLDYQRTSQLYDECYGNYVMSKHHQCTSGTIDQSGAPYLPNTSAPQKNGPGMGK